MVKRKNHRLSFRHAPGRNPGKKIATPITSRAGSGSEAFRNDIQKTVNGE